MGMIFPSAHTVKTQTDKDIDIAIKCLRGGRKQHYIKTHKFSDEAQPSPLYTTF